MSQPSTFNHGAIFMALDCILKLTDETSALTPDAEVVARIEALIDSDPLGALGKTMYPGAAAELVRFARAIGKMSVKRISVEPIT